MLYYQSVRHTIRKDSQSARRDGKAAIEAEAFNFKQASFILRISFHTKLIRAIDAMSNWLEQLNVIKIKNLEIFKKFYVNETERLRTRLQRKEQESAMFNCRFVIFSTIIRE